MADYTFIDRCQNRLTPASKSIQSQVLFQDASLKVSIFHLAKGQTLKEHSSSNVAILQILEGEALLTLGKDEVQASADAWVHIPAHLNHSVKALSDLSMLLSLTLFPDPKKNKR